MPEHESSSHMDLTDADDGSSCTIRLRDAFLNYAFADQVKDGVKDACKERLDHGVKRFVVDISTVDLMDSCGLSVLIGIRKLVTGAGGNVAVVATSPTLLRLFDITRLTTVLQVVGDVPAALDLLRRGEGAESALAAAATSMSTPAA